MKGKVRFKVKTKSCIFEVTLCSKYTLFVGESGTHKTLLHKSILLYNKGESKVGASELDPIPKLEYKIKVESPVPIKALTSDNLQLVEQLSNCIIIFDESSRRISKGIFAKITKESDCYFIFINRRYVKQYPINMNSLFYLKEDPDGVVRNYLCYPELQFENLKKTYFGDILFSEDMSSGRQLLEAIYNRDVSSLYGKDSIPSKLVNNEIDDSIIFADAAAFAQVIINLQDLNSHNIQFILYQSIEWLMLHAKEFEEVCKILKYPSEFIDSGEYNNWERYFTDLFIMMCEKYFDGYKYTKSELPQQILSDTNLNIFRDIMPKIYPLVDKHNFVYGETNLFP